MLVRFFTRDVKPLVIHQGDKLFATVTELVLLIDRQHFLKCFANRPIGLFLIRYDEVVFLRFLALKRMLNRCGYLMWFR